MKIYTVIQQNGDDYGPGFLEILVEGEKFGGGEPRVVGFADNTPESLAEVIAKYPGIRVFGVKF